MFDFRDYMRDPYLYLGNCDPFIYDGMSNLCAAIVLQAAYNIHLQRGAEGVINDVFMHKARHYREFFVTADTCMSREDFYFMEWPELLEDARYIGTPPCEHKNVYSCYGASVEMFSFGCDDCGVRGTVPNWGRFPESGVEPKLSDKEVRKLLGKRED